MSKGISILTVVIMMSMLSILGAALAPVMVSYHQSRNLYWESSQAFYAAEGGLEFALREIDQGGYPNVTDKGFFNVSSFSVDVSQTTHTITSTGRSGQAISTVFISDDELAGDCLDVNNEYATLVGPDKNELKAIAYKKQCLNAITLDKMEITWDPNSGEKVTYVEIDNNTLYDNPIGAGSGEVIDLTNYKLDKSKTYQTNLIKFTSNMQGKALTIKTVLTDRSAVTTAFTILPPGK